MKWQFHRIRDLLCEKLFSSKETYNLFTGSVAVPRAVFGQGTLQIAMSDVRCVGNEASLLECGYNENSRYCSHGNDAGVRCHIQTSKHTDIFKAFMLNSSILEKIAMMEILG